MEIKAVLGVLNEADVSIWLDAEGKLRIDKGASLVLKDMVREHKQPLIDVRTALDLMNGTGIRIIRLPLGHNALAYPLGANLDQIRWALNVLGHESMPLVVNDEGLRSMTWHKWQLHQSVWTREDRDDYLRRREAEQNKPRFGRKSA